LPRPDGLGDALHREATFLAGLRDTDLQDVDGPEGSYPPLARDQDAVGDQPLDLLFSDARPGGQLRAGQLLGRRGTCSQLAAHPNHILSPMPSG
jgi:hypothetical protein